MPKRPNNQSDPRGPGTQCLGPLATAFGDLYRGGLPLVIGGSLMRSAQFGVSGEVAGMPRNSGSKGCAQAAVWTKAQCWWCLELGERGARGGSLAARRQSGGEQSPSYSGRSASKHSTRIRRSVRKASAPRRSGHKRARVNYVNEDPPSGAEAAEGASDDDPDWDAADEEEGDDNDDHASAFEPTPAVGALTGADVRAAKRRQQPKTTGKPTAATLPQSRGAPPSRETTPQARGCPHAIHQAQAHGRRKPRSKQRRHMHVGRCGEAFARWGAGDGVSLITHVCGLCGLMLHVQQLRV